MLLRMRAASGDPVGSGAMDAELRRAINQPLSIHWKLELPLLLTLLDKAE
jgi:hypothetical protein